jgi:hypothetical protein
LAPFAGGHRRKNVRQVVVAALSDYLGRWEELVARTGLTLSGAVPSGWALSAACRGTGEAMGKEGELRAILRQLDGAVECTVMEGAEPFFSAVRACPHDAGPTEALALVEEALMDVPSSLADSGVTVIAPSGWYREEPFRRKGVDLFQPVEGFEARAANAMTGPGGKAEPPPVWSALGAYGAALAEKELDLLAPEKEGAGYRAASRAVTGALAVVTLLLAFSWPSAVALDPPGSSAPRRGNRFPSPPSRAWRIRSRSWATWRGGYMSFGRPGPAGRNPFMSFAS